jgi:surface protein
MLRLGNTEINALGNNINKAYLGAIEVFGNQFVSLWETTTASETITLPTPTNYIVDWGDGTVTTNTNSHEYLTANQYTIKISGEITDFSFNDGGDKLKILNSEKAGGLMLIDNSFYGCSNLEYINGSFKKPIGSLGDAFLNCHVFNSDLLGLDVSDVTNIGSMFREAALFNGDISNWQTGNVISLGQTFYQASSFNGDVSQWDVAKVTNMSAMMFQSSSFNGDVSNWDTDSLINCATAFQDAVLFDSDIGGWKVGKVTQMQNMMRNTSFNHPLNLWDTSKVTNMSVMFGFTTSFNQDISSWSFVSVIRIDSFMLGKTANDYDATYYDDLLIKWDNAIGGLVFANMVNVNIGMGTIKYTVAGAAARASLVSKGFIISDGGQV